MTGAPIGVLASAGKRREEADAAWLFEPYEQLRPLQVSVADGSDYHLGLEFYVVEAATLHSIRILAGDDGVATTRLASLWRVSDQARLWAGPAALPTDYPREYLNRRAGWAQADNIGVELAPNVRYRAAVAKPAGATFFFQTGMMADFAPPRIETGKGVVPGTSEVAGQLQCPFYGGGALMFPGGSYGNSYYGVDVMVS